MNRLEVKLQRGRAIEDGDADYEATLVGGIEQSVEITGWANPEAEDPYTEAIERLRIGLKELGITGEFVYVAIDRDARAYLDSHGLEQT